ncbi:MAG: Omp28-related outer membrane protein [Bacteroidetes bacterium]|nr:Omp28-related outer membrane protein [Bacteroidota bacterium]
MQKIIHLRVKTDYMKSMRFILPVLALGFALFSTGCKKKKEDTPGGGGTNPTVTTYTRKAYVEDFTGTWCGWCPLMSYTLEQKQQQHGSKLIFVGMHYGPTGGQFDPYHSNTFLSLMNRYGINAFPTGLVNRQTVVSSSTLASNIDFAVAAESYVGIKLETTVTGTDCALNTTVKFGSDFSKKNVKLVLMLIEDGLKYNQVNYLAGNSSYQTHPYYSAGNPIPNYTHNGVFRRSITASLEGDAIPVANTGLGGQYVNNTIVSVTGIPTGKGKIVALVINDTGSNASTQVLNAQSVIIGQTQSF